GVLVPVSAGTAQAQVRQRITQSIDNQLLVRLRGTTHPLATGANDRGRVAAGRRTIEFSGTARQVEDAFQTEIHNYEVNGDRHVANAVDIAIPEALAPVVGGIVSLHDFPVHPLYLRVAPLVRSPAFTSGASHYIGTLLSGYKSNRFNWLAKSSKSSWESDG